MEPSGELQKESENSAPEQTISPVGGQCITALAELFAPSPAELRRKLRAIREHRGWSQAQAAGVFGVSKSAFEKWESGERKPGPSAILLISYHYANISGNPADVGKHLDILYQGHMLPSSGVQTIEIRAPSVSQDGQTLTTPADNETVQYARVMAAQAFIFDAMQRTHQHLVNCPENKYRAKNQREIASVLGMLSSKLAELTNLTLKIAPSDGGFQSEEGPRNKCFEPGPVVAAPNQELKIPYKSNAAVGVQNCPQE